MEVLLKISYKWALKFPFWKQKHQKSKKMDRGHEQRSPYQAVTGKIYRLWEHLLPPANAQKS